jgi:hypothetical protein
MDKHKQVGAKGAVACPKDVGRYATAEATRVQAELARLQHSLAAVKTELAAVRRGSDQAIEQTRDELTTAIYLPRWREQLEEGMRLRPVGKILLVLDPADATRPWRLLVPSRVSAEMFALLAEKKFERIGVVIPADERRLLQAIRLILALQKRGFLVDYVNAQGEYVGIAEQDTMLTTVTELAKRRRR